MSLANVRARLCEDGDKTQGYLRSVCVCVCEQVPGDMMFVRAVIGHVVLLKADRLASWRFWVTVCDVSSGWCKDKHDL